MSKEPKISIDELVEWNRAQARDYMIVVNTMTEANDPSVTDTIAELKGDVDRHIASAYALRRGRPTTIQWCVEMDTAPLDTPLLLLDDKGNTGLGIRTTPPPNDYQRKKGWNEVGFIETGYNGVLRIATYKKPEDIKAYALMPVSETLPEPTVKEAVPVAVAETSPA